MLETQAGRNGLTVAALHGNHRHKSGQSTDINTMDFISGVANWEFLNEPLYRWAIFWIALAFIAYAWNGVISFMK